MISKLEDLRKKPYIYFLTEFEHQRAGLKELKDAVIGPMRRFMAGEQKTIYDECRKFLDRAEGNFEAVDTQKVGTLRGILNDPHCYRNNRMVQARSIKEEIRKQIEEKLTQEKEITIHTIEKRKAYLVGFDDYQTLNSEQQEDIQYEIEQFVNGLASLTIIASVRDSRRRFEEVVYPGLFSRISEYLTKVPKPGDDKPGDPPSAPVAQAETISIRSIFVRHDQRILETEKDVEAYLETYKQVLLEKIRNGKRIIL